MKAKPRKPAPKASTPATKAPPPSRAVDVVAWLTARRENARAVLEAGCYYRQPAGEARRVRALEPKQFRELVQAMDDAMTAPLTPGERADHIAVEKTADSLLNDPTDAEAWRGLALALVNLRAALAVRSAAPDRDLAAHRRKVQLAAADTARKAGRRKPVAPDIALELVERIERASRAPGGRPKSKKDVMNDATASLKKGLGPFGEFSTRTLYRLLRQARIDRG